MSMSRAVSGVPSLGMGTLTRVKDLRSRLLFVLVALVIYRFGSYVPLPGINPLVLREFVASNAGGILGMFNMLSGGSLGRMTIFALSIMPYVTASIVTQLLTVLSKHFEALKKEGERGRQVINQYTRYLTALLAAFQAFGIAVGLEAVTVGSSVLVMEPGWFFRFDAAVTLVGGTVFLVWLGEQITQRGIGNGISLIIFSGIVAELPQAFSSLFEMARTGVMPLYLVFFLCITALLVIAGIVLMERAQCRIPVHYPKRQQGNKIFAADVTHLPLKLNTSGVIPPIFASSILLFPLTIANFASHDAHSWLSDVVLYLGHGKPLYMLCYVALIVFFSFFYTAIVFNAEETADYLKRAGAIIPGRRPGAHTALFLNQTLMRLTCVGAVYIASVCVLPELLVAHYAVPFYLGGTSLLIVVNVVMDSFTQIQTYLFSHQYQGMIQKFHLRGRKR